MRMDRVFFRIYPFLSLSTVDMNSTNLSSIHQLLFPSPSPFLPPIPKNFQQHSYLPPSSKSILKFLPHPYAGPIASTPLTFAASYRWLTTLQLHQITPGTAPISSPYVPPAALTIEAPDLVLWSEKASASQYGWTGSFLEICLRGRYRYWVGCWEAGAREGEVDERWDERWRRGSRGGGGSR